MAAADGTIHLSFPAMQAAEASSTHQLTGLPARREQPAGDPQPLVHRWSGDAQAAYVAQKQRWGAAAAEPATMLGAITGAPGTTTATTWPPHAGSPPPSADPATAGSVRIAVGRVPDGSGSFDIAAWQDRA